MAATAQGKVSHRLRDRSGSVSRISARDLLDHRVPPGGRRRQAGGDRRLRRRAARFLRRAAPWHPARRIAADRCDRNAVPGAGDSSARALAGSSLPCCCSRPSAYGCGATVRSGPSSRRRSPSRWLSKRVAALLADAGAAARSIQPLSMPGSCHCALGPLCRSSPAWHAARQGGARARRRAADPRSRDLRQFRRRRRRRGTRPHPRRQPVGLAPPRS